MPTTAIRAYPTAVVGLNQCGTNGKRARTRPLPALVNDSNGSQPVSHGENLSAGTRSVEVEGQHPSLPQPRVIDSYGFCNDPARVRVKFQAQFDRQPRL